MMPLDNNMSFGNVSVDELFTSQAERDEAKLQKIYDIPIVEIDPFPDHPYQVRDDEDMDNLVDSIKQNGILTPAKIRKKEDGRFEMISGHRRMKACAKAGIRTLKCEVVDVDRDEAILMMVDSNMQRSSILPSEKAKSYKMKLDAMKRQGRRTDLDTTSATSLRKFDEARSELGDSVGESRETVRKYIRLNELIPGLLDKVDENKIALRPAVELSYLPADRQRVILENIEMEEATPTHAQTIRMREMQSEGKLTDEVIGYIMQEEKPNQKEKAVIKSRRILESFPKDLPISGREDYILKSMSFYEKYRNRIKDEPECERC